MTQRGTLLLAAALVGATLGVVDSVAIFAALPSGGDEYVRAVALRACSAAICYALAVGIVYGLVGETLISIRAKLQASSRPLARRLAAIAHPLVPWLLLWSLVAVQLVSGAGIAASRWRLPILCALLVAGVLGLVVASALARRVLGHPAQASSTKLHLLRIGCALFAVAAYATGGVYPNSYQALHSFLVLLCFAAVHLLVFAFLRPVELSGAGRRVVAAVIAVLAVGSLASVTRAAPQGAARAMTFAHAQVGRYAIYLSTRIGLGGTGARDDLYAAMTEGADVELGSQMAPCDGKAASPFDVIVITVDAMRGDRLAAAGASRRVVKNLDALGHRGLVFTAAYSPSPATSTSLVPIISGMSAVTIRELGHLPATLASELDRLGYRTFSYTPFTGVSPRVFAGVNASKLGFEVTDAKKAATDISSSVIELLKSKDERPFFAYAHLIEPHAPYQQHRRFRFGDRMVDRYDSELAFVDSELGRIFDEISRQGRWSRTVVAISADHGEAFFEHGAMAHGTSLYEEMIRVPLVLVAPGVEPRIIDEPLSLLDLAPTVLASVGCGWSQPTEGRVFRPGDDREEAIVVSKQYNETDRGRRFVRRVATRRGSWKLIYDLQTQVAELYDLSGDALETRNVVSLDESAARTMQEAMLTAERRAGAVVARLTSAGSTVLVRAARSGAPRAIKESMTAILVAPDRPEALQLVDAMAASSSAQGHRALRQLAETPGLPQGLRDRITVARAGADPSSAAALLIELVASSTASNENRRRAIELLASTGQSDWLGVVKPLLSVKDDELAVAAAAALCVHEGAAGEAGASLRERFAEPAATDRLSEQQTKDVVLCLGQSGSNSDVDLLLAMYEARKSRKKAAYEIIRALGDSRNARALPFLLEQAKSRYEPIRIEATRAIAKIDDKASLSFLIGQALTQKHLRFGASVMAEALRSRAKRVHPVIEAESEPALVLGTEAADLALSAALEGNALAQAGSGRRILALYVKQRPGAGPGWLTVTVKPGRKVRVATGDLSADKRTAIYIELPSRPLEAITATVRGQKSHGIELSSAELLVF